MRLRFILKADGVARGDRVEPGLCLDPCDAGHGIGQLTFRETREDLQERSLVASLGAEEHRPFLELDEDERVNRRRQTLEELCVRPRE
jgi:hypothetical protein